MAEFITTTGTIHYIEKLIKSAKEELVIVSPYLKLSKNHIDRISDAWKRGIKITLIYGKNEIVTPDMDFLHSLKNVRIYFCLNLHAKCYHNETSLIITSMNLYEYSEKNREMGILIEKVKDHEIFMDTLDEINSIINASELKKDFETSNNITSEKDPNTLSISKKSESSRNAVKEKEADIIKKANDSKWELDPNYMNQNNFHLPALAKILKEKYNEKVVQLDGKLVAIDKFPYSGMTLEVNGRIDIKFSEKLNYEWIKQKNSDLNRTLPGIRFYWNRNQLNIYLNKKFNVGVDNDGLKIKVEKYLQIIDHLYQNLKII